MYKIGVASLLFCFIIFNVTRMTFAQPGQIRFQHIASEQGLTDLSVRHITQDKYGFMWFATHSGVARYNGYEITSYKFNSADTTTICSNRVESAFADKQGNVWFGTLYGFCKFNFNKNNFTRYLINDKLQSPNNNITVFENESDTSFFIGTAKGLYRCIHNKNSNTILVKPIHIAAFDNTYIYKLIYKNGAIYAATNDGLLIYNLSNSILMQLNAKQTGNLHLNINRIKNLTIDFENNIWLCGDNALIIKINLSTLEKKEYKQLADSKKGWSENSVGRCITDSNGYVWFTTRNSGAVCYNQSTDDFSCYINDPTDNSSIGDNELQDFFIDKDKTVWIAMSTQGVDYFNLENSYLTVLKTGLKSESKLAARWVRCFAEDPAGNIWIGTVEGISVYNPKQYSIINFQNNESNNELLTSNSIRSLLNDSTCMWIGTSNGVMRYDYQSKKIKKYFADVKNEKALQAGFVWSIFKSKNGVIYLATNKGICRYNKSTDDFYAIDDYRNGGKKISESCRGMVEDKAGNIWCITPRNGLLQLNDEEKTLRVFKINMDTSIIADDVILSIANYNDTIIWIGTSSGLYTFNTLHLKFEHIAIAAKFSSAEIANLVFENENNLWMSSNSGLIRYNLISKKYRVFSINDGLPTNDFNTQDGYRSTTGSLFFASSNGAVLIDPKKIKNEALITTPYITGLTVANKPFQSSVALTDLEHIELNYAESFFTVQFTAFNYLNMAAIEYAYKLEGFHTEWIFNGSNRNANFSNVPGGDYILKYKATLHPGIWSEQFKTLYIHIDTVYYKTWWFRAILIFVLATLIYLLYKYRVDQKLKIQNIRNKIASDLHDEVGSTLSSISVYSEILKQQVDVSQQSKSMLDIIGNDSRNMIDSMSDIVWTINPENDDMEKIIQRMENFAYQVLSAKNIELNFNVDVKSKQVQLPMVERKNFYLVFKEAVNNAAKYSDASLVDVSITIKNGNMILIIADNGKGIEALEINPQQKKWTHNGNGLKNMNNRAKEINARFEINSTVNKGTRIILELKIP